ncbi:MAG: hypothetical protein Tsb0024_00070 [Ruegeria sp.]
MASRSGAVAKAEWGTKRSCPKCGERFYDLGKDDPVVCIECGHEWTPEPILKSKQPVHQEPVKKVAAVKVATDDDEDEDLIDDDVDIDLDDEDDPDLDDDDDDVPIVVDKD